MTGALAIIFGFMIFMLILNKGRLLFVNISSLLIIAAISLGVGYGIATFVGAIGLPLLFVLVVIVAFIFFSRTGGDG